MNFVKYQIPREKAEAKKNIQISTDSVLSNIYEETAPVKTLKVNKMLSQPIRSILLKMKNIPVSSAPRSIICFDCYFLRICYNNPQLKTRTVCLRLSVLISAGSLCRSDRIPTPPARTYSDRAPSPERSPRLFFPYFLPKCGSTAVCSSAYGPTGS